MREEKWLTLFLYILGFILVWEWLRPIEQLTNTNYIELFIAFILLGFVLTFFQVKWYFSLLIKSVYILVSIYFLYFKQEDGWLSAFFQDLAHNLGLLFSRDWNQFSDEFRTLLFFLFLSILVYLIHYWMMKRQQILLFFFMTLVYITVLDTFTTYKADAAIVRTVITGFATIGVLKFSKIFSTEKVSRPPGYLRKWLMLLAVMLSVSLAVGFAAPKADPIWPDPVPYLKAAKDGAGNKDAVARLGYRDDDSRLGGPFTGDKNVVFRVEAPGKNYWRIETRDTYTGKGWVSSSTGSSGLFTFMKKMTVPNNAIPSTVDSSEAKADLFVYLKYPFLLYPAGVKTISADQQVTFRMDLDRDKIYTFDKEHQSSSLDRYTVAYQIPRYKVADLQSADAKANMDPRMSNDFYRRFTQLPVQLPPRVRALAEQIAGEKTNWFDKAKAIEAYLNGPDFTYDQKNVAVPGEQEDYVDQFLFDTKRGYCDNFSTSMVVLTRSLGIPARWVKGFNGGEFLQYSKKGSGRQIYEITNNNAHSWVEVYLPFQGWVPFEPTKGFSNGVQLINSTDSGSATNNGITAPVPAKKKPQQLQKEATSGNSETSRFNFSLLWFKIKTYIAQHNTSVFIYFLLAAGVGLYLYRIRRKWIPLFLLLRFRLARDEDSVGAAYLALLKQLHRYGLKRKESETLRNYAEYVDSFFSTRDMSKLTAVYEEFVYHPSSARRSWKSSRELWENLIKKTIA